MKSTKVIKTAAVLGLAVVISGTSSAFARTVTPSEDYLAIDSISDYVGAEVVTNVLGNDIYQDFTLPFTTSVFDNYDLTELSTDATASARRSS